MATLLQDAAGDWWTALLKERHGSRPADYTEMSALLRKRFGSSTRVDRARAALRNIKQSTNENVRAYSTRFESLLSKLPSFDAEWAKSQYIWGLNQRVAELSGYCRACRSPCCNTEGGENRDGTRYSIWQSRPNIWGMAPDQQRKIFSRTREICSCAADIRSWSSANNCSTKLNPVNQGQGST